VESLKIKKIAKKFIFKFFLLNYVIFLSTCNDSLSNTNELYKYNNYDITPREFTFTHNKFSKDFTFQYYFLNPEYYDYHLTKNYTKISELPNVIENSQISDTFSSNNDYYMAVKKNHLNYSLNDAFFLDFGAHQKIENPRHLQFSFYIGEVNDPDNFEGCNLRLTNFTLESLLNNSLRTNYSDPLLFRIRNNQSICINDQSYFLNFTSYNFKSPTGFNLVDLFLNWETNSILFLYNKLMLDMYSGQDELFTSFFHINLMQNYTKPSKVLFYNLYPNTSCYIKNLVLCEDFCDEESRLLYMNYTNDGRCWISIGVVNLLCLILFFILL
jgi:hypothetical protein